MLTVHAVKNVVYPGTTLDRLRDRGDFSTPKV
jgi:hypothetical protein